MTREIKQIKKTEIVSTVLSDGSIIETVLNPKRNKTSLAVWQKGKFEIVEKYEDGFGNVLIPLKTSASLLENRIILFPSKPVDFDSKEQLILEIQQFIHKYVDVSPIFEKICCYYVLLSWVHDNFNELPYLRKRGDFGSGKTRFLQTIGSLCYKPIFASGGTSTAALFHMTDKYKGTLIIDEADFTFSDEKAAISKILNNGNVRGFPILRMKKDKTGNFTPVGYTVYGPKIIAARGYYQDPALESRFISENSTPREIRENMPVSLPDSFQDEALILRNKLLMYRFMNLGKRKSSQSQVAIYDPRIKQIFSPLLSIVDDEDTQREIVNLADEYSQELSLERGMNVEANVLSVIKIILDEKRKLTMKEISNEFFLLYGENYERKITPKWIGWIIRKKLNLTTFRGNEGYAIKPGQKKKLQMYFIRYGV